MGLYRESFGYILSLVGFLIHLYIVHMPPTGNVVKSIAKAG
jgi:hypothetical protein